MLPRVENYWSWEEQARNQCYRMVRLERLIGYTFFDTHSVTSCKRQQMLLDNIHHSFYTRRGQCNRSAVRERKHPGSLILQLKEWSLGIRENLLWQAVANHRKTMLLCDEGWIVQKWYWDRIWGVRCLLGNNICEKKGRKQEWAEEKLHWEAGSTMPWPT